MMAATQEDHAEIQLRQYYAAKDQAQREYKTLKGKDELRSLLDLIMYFFGATAILQYVAGIPAPWSILGGLVALAYILFSEKNSAKLRDSELALQSFITFEQWKIDHGFAKAEEKFHYEYDAPKTQYNKLSISTNELSKSVKEDKQAPPPLLTVKIFSDTIADELSSAVIFLKSACKCIDTGKPLRPHENLKLVIADINKLRRRKYFDLDQFIDITSQVDNIRSRFDPFIDEFVWDQLRLCSEIMQEIIDLNFEELDQPST